MLKKASRFVLASFRLSTYSRGYVSDLYSLRPCMGQGASMGEEAVLTDSGRAGEIAARVGWVRTETFLTILRNNSPTCHPQIALIIKPLTA
jgi:hypothetical protein